MLFKAFQTKINNEIKQHIYFGKLNNNIDLFSNKNIHHHSATVGANKQQQKIAVEFQWTEVFKKKMSCQTKFVWFLKISGF